MNLLTIKIKATVLMKDFRRLVSRGNELLSLGIEFQDRLVGVEIGKL